MSLPDVAATAPVSHGVSRFPHMDAGLTSLEYQLHETEYRLRRDLLERDAAWRERMTSAMSLIARMLAEGFSRARPNPRPQHEKTVSKDPGELPTPGLEPRAITLEEFHAHTPEKVELLGGFLFGPADDLDARRRLLNLLLVNVGLLEAVKLGPEERWREALERAYGSAGT